MIRKLGRLGIVAGSGIAALALMASPAAWAQNCSNPQTSACVNVTGTVPTTISFTLTTPTTVGLTLTPGSQTLAPQVVAWTVGTNDPAGYSVTGYQMAVWGPGGNPIQVTDQPKLNGSSFGQPFQYSPLNGFLVGSSTQAVTADQGSENWQVSTPGNLPPGNYPVQFIYVAAGN